MKTASPPPTTPHTTPPPAPDDAPLLRGFRARDRAAFDTLYDRYAGRLLAFSERLTGCHAEAEDLVQETFVAAFKGAGGFRGGARLFTYLAAIAVRRHRDTRRGAASRPIEAEWNEEAGNRLITLGSRVEEAALARVAFGQAVATLDAPLREAFLLVAAQGLTHREAAEIVGVPVGTMKWRVAHATRRLRAALEEKDV